MTATRMLRQFKADHDFFDTGVYEDHEIISLMKRFADQEVKKSRSKKAVDFIRSKRARQLSEKLKEITGVELEPLIGRRYYDNENIKFEMLDKQGKAFHFEGLVKDFLSKNADIYFQERTFKLNDF